MAKKKNAKVTDTQLTKPQTRLERYLGTIAGLFSDAPTDPRTRLERYLDAIVQGGGGGGGGGTNPTGTVIYFAGTTAPNGYLVCDGAIYNIVDHPALAQFFADNYGSVNYWGGDGAATFAVPDWRGEFFRASGQNSHANQGSGVAVGAHQDATAFPMVRLDRANSYAAISVYTEPASLPLNYDGEIQTSLTTNQRYVFNGGWGSADQNGIYNVRPTSTSLLVCIKA